MPQKQQDNQTLVFIGILVIAGVIWYGGQQGWFKSVNNDYSTESPLAPLEIQHEFLTYNVAIDLVPDNICAGATTTGSITSNIPNGVCSIYVKNGANFVLLTNANLDWSGAFSTTQRIYAIGTAIFRAVCCDGQGNCRISNDHSLTVRDCDTDSDGNPDSSDPDDDNDGWSDEDELEAGTDPKDPNDYPDEYNPNPDTSQYTCGQSGDLQCDGTCPSEYPSCEPVNFGDYDTCVCLNQQSQEIAPDWKPNGVNHNQDLFTEQVNCDIVAASYGYDHYANGGYEACSTLANANCGGVEFVSSLTEAQNCCLWDCKPCGALLTWSGNTINGQTSFANAWSSGFTTTGSINLLKVHLGAITESVWVPNPSERCMDYLLKDYEDTEAWVELQGYENDKLVRQVTWYITPNYR